MWIVSLHCFRADKHFVPKLVDVAEVPVVCIVMCPVLACVNKLGLCVCVCVCCVFYLCRIFGKSN